MQLYFSVQYGHCQSCCCGIAVIIITYMHYYQLSSRLEQITPEAPPGVLANPRRLATKDAFKDLYGSTSSSESESDSLTQLLLDMHDVHMYYGLCYNCC